MRAHILNEAGLILDTCMVDDLSAGMVDADLHGGGPGDSIINGALVRKPAPQAPKLTVDELAAIYIQVVQDELDRTARVFGYDSMAVAVTYAEEPAVPRFQAEGQALRAWRSLVWATCYAMLAEVKAGTMPVPSEAEVLTALPPAPVQE